MMMAKSLPALLIILLSFPSLSQSQLTIEKIMMGDDFVGHLPSNPEWSEDGKTIYFQWNPDNNPGDSLYKYELGSASPIKVSFEERNAIPAFDGEYNAPKTAKVYTKDNDIFIYDLKTKKTTRITNTLSRENSPYFHGEKIHFTENNNLFEWDRNSGSITQLTDIKSSAPPKSKKESNQDKWLSNDQKTLSQIIREREDKEEHRKTIREKQAFKRPHTIYLDGNRVRNIKMSPDGNYITYSLIKPAKPTNTMVPEYVTSSGYTESTDARPKVGSELDDIEAWIYKRDSDTTYQVKTDDLPGIKDTPDFYKDYPKLAEKTPEVRKVYSHGPIWSEDGRYAVMVHRSKDNKDRWITLLDPETGTNSILDRQRDEAWIGGPGIGYGAYSAGEIGWMPDNKRIWLQSEESGYSHLYTIDIFSKTKKALTSGNFEVYSPRLGNDKKNWYFSSNEGDPGQRHFYTMPLEGGSRNKITPKEGNNDVTLSLDEKKLAVLHSYANKPWELFVMDNKSDAKMRQITN